MKKWAYQPRSYVITSILGIVVTLVVIIAFERVRILFQREGAFAVELMRFLLPNPFIPLSTGIALGLIAFGFEKRSLRLKANVELLVNFYTLNRPPFLLRIKVGWIFFKPYFLMCSLMGLIWLIVFITEEYRFLVYFNYPTLLGAILPHGIVYPEIKRIALKAEAEKSKRTGLQSSKS